MKPFLFTCTSASSTPKVDAWGQNKLFWLSMRITFLLTPTVWRKSRCWGSFALWFPSQNRSLEPFLQLLYIDMAKFHLPQEIKAPSLVTLGWNSPMCWAPFSSHKPSKQSWWPSLSQCESQRCSPIPRELCGCDPAGRARATRRWHGRGSEGRAALTRPWVTHVTTDCLHPGEPQRGPLPTSCLPRVGQSQWGVVWKAGCVVTAHLDVSRDRTGGTELCVTPSVTVWRHPSSTSTGE